MNNEKSGILYCATGDRYVQEMLQSARATKRVMPDLPIALFTDRELKSDKDLFEKIMIWSNPRYSWLDKMEPLPQTPFERTLYLDTDTLIIEPIYELFELLDNFDLAYAHAPIRYAPDYELKNCPASFVEANAGILLYRMNHGVRQFFAEWVENYNRQYDELPDTKTDQPALRKTLFETDIKTTVFPPEYNYRTEFPSFAGGSMKVKIIHGRDPGRTKAARTVNRKLDVRVADYSKLSLHRRVFLKIKSFFG